MNSKELFQINLKLAFYMANDFVARRRKFMSHVGLEPDDIDQVALIGLWSAALRFDPTKGKFSTFACQWIRGMLKQLSFRAYREHAVSSTDDNLESVNDPRPDPADVVAERDFDRALMAFVESLPPNLTSTVRYRLQGETLEQIGQREGITKQAVLCRYQRAISMLQSRFA